MHEKEIEAIHYILDFICANKYIKYGIERYLVEHDIRFWDINGLLDRIIKIRADIKEIDRPENGGELNRQSRISIGYQESLDVSEIPTASTKYGAVV